MKFIQTTAQAKIARLRGRYRIVSGGTGASKTFSILPILYSYAASKPNISISVVSESFPHLRKGAIRDFQNILKSTGHWRKSNWHDTNSIYTLSNGSYIEFFSADNDDKLRGSRRDILFINEANRVSREAYLQISMRTRKFIYMDFNPSERFWAHDDLENSPRATWLTLTYKDNEAIDKEIIADLEEKIEWAKSSEYWRNYVNVYVYGKLGSRQGVIFKEFESWESIATIPSNARLIGCGMDFGYTNDPSSLIAVYYLDGVFIADQVFYETRMSNRAIAERIIQNNLHKVQIWADSAEPKSIEEIQGHGVWIEPVVKGPDSIRYGIGLMHQNKFLVTQRSTELIKELRGYSWEEKNGIKSNAPAKGQADHAIDALRYGFMGYLGGDRQELFFA